MEIDTFRAMCNLAIKWNYLRQNPLKDVTILKVTDAKAPRFLTREECQILLQECGPELYPVFYIFLYTGMRLSELLNLTWDDLDFTRHKIKIQKKPFWHPKTGEREIPISPETEKLLQGLNQNGIFIFNLQGKKIRFNYLRVQLMKITKRCGFPDVTKIHSLRHTFASHLVMNGVDLPTIQKLLGHSEIETTMIYAHLAPDHLVEAVNKLNFGNKNPP
jgi:integrase